MIRADFWDDPRPTPTAKGVAAFIAEHDEPIALRHVVDYFRDPPLVIARALDELEALGFVRRVTPDQPTPDNVFYFPTANLIGEVTA